ncbi:MAG: transporter substrate-binding domain-containing protein [Acidobacteriaceae bacterium]
MRMVSCRTTRRSTVQLALTLVVWIVLMPAASRRSAAAMVDATNAQAQSAHKASSEKSSTQSAARGLPLTFARETGDLNSMVKRRRIRALVFYSRTGFFYVNGRPQGINYEALRAFEEFVNQKLHTGRQHVQVTFIPIRPDEAESALTQGVGDLIAYGVVVTPEREKKVAFSIPVATNIKQIVVTGKGFGQVTSLQDLSGKKIYVNPLTTYYDNLQKVNISLRKQGKPPILIEKADANLGDEDLMEMVNAGIIPATVTITERATLWASVLPNITAHPDLVIASQQDLAWAMRKNNPELKAEVDEFVRTHGLGTSFGNTLLRRYLQNTKWIKNPTTAAEIKKFNENIAFFKKYAAQYSMDYLLVVAQGYQESMLNQSARNGGAVGIMQVKPALAAAAPINVHDVTIAQNNIEAGVKMLHTIEDKYFNDPKIDPMNRLLLTFAAYNAGPTRIAALRRKAAAQGLDPNVWFGNVELVVAQSVGQITVQYVSNIYKYYVAYKLVVQQGGTLQ